MYLHTIQGKFISVYCLLATLSILILYNYLQPTRVEHTYISIEPIATVDYRDYHTPTIQEIMDSLTLYSKEQTVDTSLNITYDEAQMLMRIAQAEATGDGVEGKAAVMMVVLNRVKDPAFPDTIEEVIFDPGQFSPVSDGRYYDVTIDVECHIALAEVERGTYSYIKALYFENAEASWQADNCEFLYTIGHHRFYK